MLIVVSNLLVCFSCHSFQWNQVDISTKVVLEREKEIDLIANWVNYY